MPSAGESSGAQSQQASALVSGLNSLAARQEVQFTRYQRVALASDGSVFWVQQQATTMTAIGSLHYATDRAQDEDATLGISDIIFSSQSEVTQLSAIAPENMWIGSWAIEGAPPLRIAFSHQANYFREADVWHYSGIALLAPMLTQIIEAPDDIPAGPIVSNSLPIWIAQNSLNGCPIKIYPSFLVPSNITPKYIAVHIEPGETEALGAFPIIGPWPGNIVPNSGASPLHNLASSQLCRDEVTLTLYGFDNEEAWQYWVALIEASMNGTALFGFANSPVIQDDKRPQVEIAALAQKKTIHISANYNQGASNAIARRLILEAMVDVSFIGGVLPAIVGSVTQGEQTAAGSLGVFE